MTRWHLMAVLCALVAAVQCIAVLGQVSHLGTLVWKAGCEQALSAGSSMLVTFFGLSLFFIAASVFTSRRLTQMQSRLRYCSLVASHFLTAGALLWAGLILSPLVFVMER